MAVLSNTVQAGVESQERALSGLSAATHALNNAITVIVGNLELAQIDSHHVREALEAALEAADHVRALRALLDVDGD